MWKQKWKSGLLSSFVFVLPSGVSGGIYLLFCSPVACLCHLVKRSSLCIYREKEILESCTMSLNFQPIWLYRIDWAGLVNENSKSEMSAFDTSLHDCYVLSWSHSEVSWEFWLVSNRVNDTRSPDKCKVASCASKFCSKSRRDINCSSIGSPHHDISTWPENTNQGPQKCRSLNKSSPLFMMMKRLIP